MAVVNHRGEVFWTRQGNLDVLCRFSGLVMFPFDQMSCPIDVGGWIAGGREQGIRSADSGCASMGGKEEVSRTSYADVELDEVECSEHTYHYPCCPDDPYPIIKYRLKMRREASYYLIWTLLPSVVITLLSFSVFFMSFKVGERLGVGVTLVLTNEISRSSLQSHIPICGEMLWLDMLILLNMTFSMLSLVESCIILGLSFSTSEDLLPKGLRDMMSMCGLRRSRRANNSGSSMFDYDSIAGQLVRSGEQLGAGFSAATQGVTMGVSAAARGIIFSSAPSAADPVQQVLRGADQPIGAPSRDGNAASQRHRMPMPCTPMPPSAPPSPASHPEFSQNSGMMHSTPSAYAADSAEIMGDWRRNHRQSTSRRVRGSGAGDVSSKLIFFENLFFNLDVDGSGTITFDEMRRMLAFMALELSTEERETALHKADSSGKADGKLTRSEYMDLCVQILWNQPLDQMKEAARSYADYRAALKRGANMRWRSYADTIDRYCSFWIPTLYLVMFTAFYSLELDDRYSGSADRYSADGTELPWNATEHPIQVARLPAASSSAEEWFPMLPWFDAIIFKQRFGSRPLVFGMFIAFGCLILLWTFVQYRSWRLEKIALLRGRQFIGHTSVGGANSMPSDGTQRVRTSPKAVAGRHYYF